MPGVVWKGIPDLYKAMKEAGASWYSRMAMIRRERLGQITIPRVDPNPRNKFKGDRKLTQEMIEEIVEEFIPGGSGRWHYKDSTAWKKINQKRRISVASQQVVKTKIPEVEIGRF